MHGPSKGNFLPRSGIGLLKTSQPYISVDSLSGLHRPDMYVPDDPLEAMLDVI